MEIDSELIITVNSLVKDIEVKRKYGKYARAISKLTPWLYEHINQSPDKKIIVKIRDIAKEMGSEFEKKSDSAIYWGVKYVLFHEGIVVDIGTSKKDERMLVMRIRNEEDQLPPSLKKYVERSISDKKDEKIPELKIYDIFT